MTIIKNGLVVDGTGAPAFPADVVVEGDRIASVERRADDARSADSTAQTGAETIDASGCLVTPGFIDVHSHSDAYLVLEPSAPSKVLTAQYNAYFLLVSNPFGALITIRAHPCSTTVASPHFLPW